MSFWSTLLLTLLAATLTRAEPTPQGATREVSDAYAASARVQRVAPLGALQLDAKDAAARPAALGEPARALFDAAGVSRSSFAGSELLLWGAAGNETRVYVDGMEIPSLFHSAGFRTTVHPIVIDSVRLIPGAAGADYGRGLGGVVELDTKGPRQGARIGASADAIDTSVHGQLINKRGGMIAGLRYGYLDRVVSALAPHTADVLALPAHADGVLKLMLRMDAESELSLTWLGSRDRVDMARSDGRERRQLDFHSLGLQLVRRYRDGARIRITPFVGLSDQRERSAFSSLPIALRQDSIQFGLRASYARSFGWLSLSAGVDLKGSHDRLRRRGTLTLPARDGDVRLFAQAPVDAIAADGWRATLLNAALHLTLSARLQKLTLEPALRLENMLVSASRAVPTLASVPATGVDRFYTFFEPRARIAYRISDHVALEARSGIYHQAPSSADLSAVFGSPTLRPARAIHGAAGPRLTLARGFVIECVGYYRYLTDLAVRSEERPPELANALVSRGKGQSYGAALSVRGEPAPGLSLALSYTLGRSTRTSASGNTYLFDHDQTHVVSALAGYTAKLWSAALGLRGATGSPRTRVIDSYFDTTSGRSEPLFGVYNGARLPFFLQFNVHAEYRFSTRPVAGALLLDVLNLSNRRNIEQVAYDTTFSARRDVTGLPVLATLGLRVEY